MAQDDYYYEIQLTNKQLIFYFMAGAAGLILSFLAGVMVGRGVDQAAEAQGPRQVREERIVPEESAKPAPGAAATAEPLTYAQRLESERPEDALEPAKPAEGASRPSDKAGAAPAKAASGAAKPEPAAAKPAPAAPKPTPAASKPTSAAPKPTPAAPKPTDAPEKVAPAAGASAPSPGAGKPAPAPAAEKPAPKPASAAPARPAPGAFTIQVGAFKDRAAADSVASRLKGKGFAAYVLPPDTAGGLFNVRVGTFQARADAEHVQAKLRDEERFKPFIVKN